jgi:formylglycine-generating enzyme required for sulfatase activity
VVLGDGVIFVGLVAVELVGELLLGEAEDHLRAGDYLSAAAAVERARAGGWSERHQAVRDLAFGVFPVAVRTVPAGARVWVRVVDAATGAVAPGRLDTATSVEDGSVELRLGIGCHLVTAIVPGFGWSEHLLEVSRGPASRRLDVVLRPTAECTENMVLVPAGRYRVGRAGAEHRRASLALPEREVDLAAYWIDRTEVSRAQFAAFARATGREVPWSDEDLAGTTGQLPATGVAWNEARAYAEWAGKRLPTETEWEVAARGSEGRPYPWGLEFLAENAVLGPAFVAPSDGPVRVPLGGSAVVVDAATADQSPFGCLHLCGNVREWTSTPWHVHDDGRAAEWLLPRIGQVVVRGSSYRQGANRVACDASARAPFYRDEGGSDVGFRCAKSDLR